MQWTVDSGQCIALQDGLSYIFLKAAIISTPLLLSQEKLHLGTPSSLVAVQDSSGAREWSRQRLFIYVTHCRHGRRRRDRQTEIGLFIYIAHYRHTRSRRERERESELVLQTETAERENERSNQQAIEKLSEAI